MSLLKSIIKPLITLAALTLSYVCHAHPDHKVQDRVLSELKDLGKVDFPTSCEENTQQAVNEGVALLHHMMYAQAENHFTKWIHKSPSCAILYWGYSMSFYHPLWPDSISRDALGRGQSALEKALALTATTREKEYIRAAAAYFNNWQHSSNKQRVASWAAAQQQLHLLYPEDIDATSLFALSLLAKAPKSDTAYTQQKKAGELLNEVFKNNSSHPGAIHYTIHAYDNPLLAPLADRAASAYSSIAPDVPHALHMPSHIFVRLGHWDKVASWNVRSAKAALKYPTKGTTSLHYVHALDYLVYSYMQTGNVADAKEIINQLEQHHPIQTTFPSAYALTTIPARIVLESKQWKQASKLDPRTPDYFNWDKFPQVEAITYFAKGIGAARSNNIKSARESLLVLNELFEQTEKTNNNYWIAMVKSQKLMVEAWINQQLNKPKLAISLARKSAEIEDSMDKNPVTPGSVLPARELLADMLMLNGSFAEALKEYKACLKISPNRKNSLQGINIASARLEGMQTIATKK
ncbi:MAG: hypothetical protein KUG78_09290 [Kangiellaceae bacterium]|nr:hypothetical protein [Kangiellaceae bacterium]